VTTVNNQVLIVSNVLMIISDREPVTTSNVRIFAQKFFFRPFRFVMLVGNTLQNHSCWEAFGVAMYRLSLSCLQPW